MNVIDIYRYSIDEVSSFLHFQVSNSLVFLVAMIEYATSSRVSSRSLTQNWVHDSIIHGCARIIPVHGGREKPNQWPNTAFTSDTDINDQQHVDMLVQNVWEGPRPFSQRK